MIETILRRVIIAGAFLVLLVPFVVTESSFFPYIVGKAVVFRLIVSLMLGAWTALAIMNPSCRPRWSPIMVAALVFLVVVGLADVLGLNPLRSFWSNFERMEGFVTLFHIVSYLFITASVIRSEKIWARFWNASIAASVVASLFAFSEIHRDFPGQLVRVDGTLGNPTYLAVYLLINIFIACLLAYRAISDRSVNKAVVGAYGCAIIIQIFGMYYAGTRGAFLGLVAGVGIATLVMLVRGREHPRVRRIAGAIVGLTLIFVGAFFALRDTAFIQDNPTLARVANISLADPTVQARITLWSTVGKDAFLERPLLGWGQDNFIIAFGKYYDPSLYNQEPWFDRAHNVFLDWLIAAGLIGGLAYVGIFLASLWMLWKSGLTLPEKAILTGLLGAYACNNLFVFDNLISYLCFAAVLAYIHVRSYSAEDDNVRSVAPLEAGPLILVGAAILSVVLIWFTAARPLVRAQSLLDALRVDHSTHDPVAVLSLYERALAYGSMTGLEETREQLSQSAIRSLNNPDADPEGRTAIVNRAISELAESATEEPENTRRLFFLAHMLKEAERFDDARAIFAQALAINPTRQSFLYEVAQTHLAQGDFDTAAEIFLQAYQAYEKNEIAIEYHAASLIFAGRVAQGEAVLIERFGTTTIDNDLLLSAYNNADRKDRVVEILERRLIDMAPADDPAVRLSLAIVYLDLGRREDAIVQLERAAELKPAFAQQAGEMIQAIKEGKKIKITQ